MSNKSEAGVLSDLKPASKVRDVRRRRRGSAVMEASLALPVLLYFSFGMIEFGQYFYAKHTLQSASRDGCRQAILGTATTAAAPAAVANTMSAAGFASSGYTLTFTNTAGSTTYSDISTVAAGTAIKATVTVNYGAVGVRPLGIISATKQVVGITTMVKE